MRHTFTFLFPSLPPSIMIGEMPDLTIIYTTVRDGLLLSAAQLLIIHDIAHRTRNASVV